MKPIGIIYRGFGLILSGLLLSRCGLVVGTAAIAVQTVSAVGYGVYRSGEGIVNVVGSVATAGAKGVQGLIYSGGHLKVEVTDELERVYNAAYYVFHDMRFLSIEGKQDGLSAKLEAKTIKKEKIVLELKWLEKKKTAFSLKIGKAGNLKSSQLVYDNILEALDMKQEKS